MFDLQAPLFEGTDHEKIAQMSDYIQQIHTQLKLLKIDEKDLNFDLGEKIKNGSGVDLTEYATKRYVQDNAGVSDHALLSHLDFASAGHTGFQAQLVSGTNIKTINNNSILGSGNLDISGGGGTVTPSSPVVVATASGDSYQPLYTLQEMFNMQLNDVDMRIEPSQPASDTDGWSKKVFLIYQNSYSDMDSHMPSCNYASTYVAIFKMDKTCVKSISFYGHNGVGNQMSLYYKTDTLNWTPKETSGEHFPYVSKFDFIPYSLNGEIHVDGMAKATFNTDGTATGDNLIYSNLIVEGQDSTNVKICRLLFDKAGYAFKLTPSDDDLGTGSNANYSKSILVNSDRIWLYNEANIILPYTAQPLPSTDPEGNWKKYNFRYRFYNQHIRNSSYPSVFFYISGVIRGFVLYNNYSL